jgi:LysM repeat protein
MRFSIWMGLVLLVCAAAFATPADSLRTEKRGEQWVVIHRVESGETLFRIAKRYKADVNQIVRQNNIKNESISVGQIIEVPIAAPRTMPANTTKPSGNGQKIHVVKQGEGLFAIARQYGVSVNEIKEWNNLTSDNLSLGQELKIGKGATTPVTQPQTDRSTVTEGRPPFAGAKKHTVKTGETVSSIARTYSISADSLLKWNGGSTDIKMGQTIWYRIYSISANQTQPTQPVTQNTQQSTQQVQETTTQPAERSEPAPTRNEPGKKKETGVAMVIEDLPETTKYLALHRTLPVGTLLEVTNPMNGKKAFVRVVGKLPDTGINNGIMIRLTPVAFKKLGILDAQARVDLSYTE